MAHSTQWHATLSDEESNPKYPISCSKGSVELAEIRQLVSSLGQEASLCAVDGEVSIALDRIVVLQPGNDSLQELNLPLTTTIRSEVVDPDWNTVGEAGSIAYGVLEILLTVRTGSPEPVNAHEANAAAGRLAQAEEVFEPFHILRILEIAGSAELDAISGIRFHVLHPVIDGRIRLYARGIWLSEAHEVLVTCSHTLLGVAGP